MEWNKMTRVTICVWKISVHGSCDLKELREIECFKSQEVVLNLNSG